MAAETRCPDTAGIARPSDIDGAALAIRRSALVLEQGVRRELGRVDPEAKGERLRTLVRQQLESFMNSLFRRGAFAGDVAEEAYFVRCDAATSTQEDLDEGRLDISIGFAPLVPAEFVVVRIQDFTTRNAPDGTGLPNGAALSAGKALPDALGSGPGKNARSRLTWEGRLVAEIGCVRPLKRTTEVVEIRELMSSQKVPGRTEYEAITLERVLTRDLPFAEWVIKSPGADLRKDLVLETYNGAGELASAYKIARCWVAAYEALPALDAASTGIAIEQVQLANEGWERDLSVVLPG